MLIGTCISNSNTTSPVGGTKYANKFASSNVKCGCSSMTSAAVLKRTIYCLRLPRILFCNVLSCIIIKSSSKMCCCSIYLSTLSVLPSGSRYSSQKKETSPTCEYVNFVPPSLYSISPDAFVVFVTGPT